MITKTKQRTFIVGLIALLSACQSTTGHRKTLSMVDGAQLLREQRQHVSNSTYETFAINSPQVSWISTVPESETVHSYDVHAQSVLAASMQTMLTTAFYKSTQFELINAQSELHAEVLITGWETNSNKQSTGVGLLLGGLSIGGGKSTINTNVSVDLRLWRGKKMVMIDSVNANYVHEYSQLDIGVATGLVSVQNNLSSESVFGTPDVLRKLSIDLVEKIAHMASEHKRET